MNIRTAAMVTIGFIMILLPSSGSFSETLNTEAIQIHDAHLRATPPEASVAAGYLSIMNTGDMTEHLLGAKAAFARKTEIHEMTLVDDIMRMRPIAEGLKIHSGATLIMKPKGLHLMFVGLEGQVVEGQQRTVTLIFQRHGELEVTFGVKDYRNLKPTDKGENSNH